MADYQAIIPAWQQYVSSTDGKEGYGYGHGHKSHDYSETLSDIRADIGETKSTIKDTIHQQTVGFGQEFCMLDKHVGDVEARTSNHLANMERDLQNRIFESQKEALEAKCAILMKVGDEGSLTRKEVVDSRFDMRSGFEVVNKGICEVKELIKDNTFLVTEKLNANKLDEKNDKIAELRENCEAGKYSLLFSNQLNEVKSLINSVEQNQKFYSKVNQFGAGNVATPIQSAAQG